MALALINLYGYLLVEQWTAELNRMMVLECTSTSMTERLFWRHVCNANKTWLNELQFADDAAQPRRPYKSATVWLLTLA